MSTISFTITRMTEIVLVGGANLGSWAWENVIPKLQADGHRVHALTLTGFGDRAHLASPETTLSTHATDIASAIEVADLHDVVLVLHSYSGAPGTIAASRIPERIKHVLYVAAVIPQPGRTVFEIMPPGAEETMQALADAEGDGWLLPVMNDEILSALYPGHGMSAAELAWLRARSVGQPVATLRDPAPADLSAVDALPRTYLVCTGDSGAPLIAPGTPGYDVRFFDSGHWPMVTKPAGISAIISEVAKK